MQVKSIAECSKRPLKKKTEIGFQDQLSLNAGQKYCRFCNSFALHYATMSLRPLFCLFLRVATLSKRFRVHDANQRLEKFMMLEKFLKTLQSRSSSEGLFQCLIGNIFLGVQKFFFVCFDAFFSHVRMISCLPGLNQS